MNQTGEEWKHQFSLMLDGKIDRPATTWSTSWGGRLMGGIFHFSLGPIRCAGRGTEPLCWHQLCLSSTCDISSYPFLLWTTAFHLARELYFSGQQRASPAIPLISFHLFQWKNGNIPRTDASWKTSHLNSNILPPPSPSDETENTTLNPFQTLPSAQPG